MRRFKTYCQDFPTQAGGAVVALGLIAATGLIVMARLAFGAKFPDGYDSWLMLLAALAGVSTLGMIGKRATDREYAKAKASAPVPVTTTTETTSTSKETTVAAAVSAAPVPVTLAEVTDDDALEAP